jgi:hypothetical protein
MLEEVVALFTFRLLAELLERGVLAVVETVENTTQIYYQRMEQLTPEAVEVVVLTNKTVVAVIQVQQAALA